jgi:hypothetical protein
MRFKEVIAAYSEDNTKPINTLQEQNTLKIKVDGTSTYKFGLKRLILLLIYAF